MRVYSVASDLHVHELAWAPGSWTPSDITVLAGVPNLIRVLPRSASYSDHQPSQREPGNQFPCLPVLFEDLLPTSFLVQVSNQAELQAGKAGVYHAYKKGRA